MSETLFVKELKKFTSTVDVRIENTVNRLLVHHLSIKWQSVSLIMAFVAFCFGGFFYVNNLVIKSSINSSMVGYANQLHEMKKDIKSDIKKDIKVLEKEMKTLLGQSNRDVNSPYPPMYDARTKRLPAKRQPASVITTNKKTGVKVKP